MALRDYQNQAIESVWDYFGAGHTGNPLLCLAVGAGKSWILAHLIKEIHQSNADERTLLTAHRSELIVQNAEKIRLAAPELSLGIFSAQLGKRQFRQTTVAGIQSVYRKRLPRIGTVLVDECHLISRKSGSMYGQLFANLRDDNPDLRIIGLTATAYRTDSGSLVEGDDRLFTDMVCDIGIRRLIDDGWLVPFVSKSSCVEADLSQVGIRGGDYVPGEAEEAMNRDELVRAAVDEIIRLGNDRRSWLVFAAGVAHAEHIVDELKRQGIAAAGVYGHTEGRERILRDFKDGRLRALVNVEVLTTGFDSPRIDLIALLRPTRSPVLYTQILGRGSRPVCALDRYETAEERRQAIAESEKPSCLVLDFASVIRELGPIDAVQPPRPRRRGESAEEREKDAPVKICPTCRSCVHPSTRSCADCGHEWPEQPKHTGEAAVVSVMTTVEPEVYAVMRTSYRRHAKSVVGHDGEEIESVSMRVDYQCGMGGTVSEWVCFEHAGYAGKKAATWWRQHCRQTFEDVPVTVDEALERQTQLKPPRSIAVRREGKFYRVLHVGFEEPNVAEKPAEEPSELELAGI